MPPAIFGAPRATTFVHPQTAQAAPGGKTSWGFAATRRKITISAVEKQSLYRAAFKACRDYREQVASRLGRAHGEAAGLEWNQQQFWLWALDRVIEHALGEHFWIECGGQNFSRAGGRRADLQVVIAGLRQARDKLAAGGLPSFAEREKLLAHAARLANTLLE